MNDLWLIRHGETDWNIERRFQGSSDRRLNATGQAQARTLVARLRAERFDAIYASDLARVKETAALALAEHPQQTSIQEDARLREIDFGIFEGLTFDEIRAQYPEELATWEKDRDKSPHGGDTLSAVIARVDAFLQDVLVSHPDGRVLVFGHGGVLGILLSLILGLDPERWWQLRLINCTISQIQLYDEGAVLLRFNDACHINTPTAPATMRSQST